MQKTSLSLTVKGKHGKKDYSFRAATEKKTETLFQSTASRRETRENGN